MNGWREKAGREIDRTLAVLAPAWARKRFQNRHAVQALYEAAEPGRLRKRNARPGSGDVSVGRAGTRIRDSARDLEENYDIATGALDVLVANTVGTGVFPLPMGKDPGGEPAEEFNRTIIKLWRNWTRDADVSGDQELSAWQALFFRSVFRDGEAFCRTLTGRVAGIERPQRGQVPFWVQGIEADFVPLGLNDPKRNMIHGIERDKWGRPKIYHVFKQHPAGLQASQETMPINASDMIHAKVIKRLGQVRGVSLFHSIINRLDDIKDSDESERVAARVAAAMAVVIKKGDPQDYTAPGESDENVRTMSIRPGMVMDDLLPGEDISTIHSNRPNNMLIEFRQDMIRSVAAGFGASFSSLSKNYSGTYSAQRQELVEQYAIYGVLWNAFVRPASWRIYRKFVDAAIAANLVKTGGVDPLTVYDCKQSRPPLVWIDPIKEAKGLEKLRSMNWKSDSQIIAAAGDEPEETWRQIKHDVGEQEELGIVVGGPPVEEAA